MANERRLIDVDARIEEIKKAHCVGCDNYGGVKCRACWVDDAIGLIDDAPTVEAVEVVRCRDCKHYNQLEKGCDYHGYYDYVRVEKDDFCSYGERRTEE